MRVAVCTKLYIIPISVADLQVQQRSRLEVRPVPRQQLQQRDPAQCARQHCPLAPCCWAQLALKMLPAPWCRQGAQRMAHRGTNLATRLNAV